MIQAHIKDLSEKSEFKIEREELTETGMEYELVFTHFGTLIMEIITKNRMFAIKAKYISRMGKPIYDSVLIPADKNLLKKINNFIVEVRVGGDAL